MEATLTENPIELYSDDAIVVLEPGKGIDADEKVVELGVWISSIRSYLGSRPRLANTSDVAAWKHLAAPEFQVLHGGLKHCVLLTSRILSDKDGSSSPNGTGLLPPPELLVVHEILSEAILLNESFINSSIQGPGQWRAWCALLGQRMDDVQSIASLVQLAEAAGSGFLPKKLRDFAAAPHSVPPELAELVLVLPRFGLVLKWLSIVKKMLDADVPLKPALLIFVRVNELVLDLTSYISNRLDRFPDRDAELFATLDAAAYTASIELKKVYSTELAGVALMRPTPSIYARFETAYSLLNDGFQQILAGFLRVIDPHTTTLDLFPEFQIKLQQSLALREELWATAELVRDAERDPETFTVEKMKKALMEFRNSSIHYLFYKDTEIVERFIEEILVTDQTKDLVPILHRFGAFLETLFGQVSLRAVLAKHPFNRAGH